MQEMVADAPTMDMAPNYYRLRVAKLDVEFIFIDRVDSNARFPEMEDLCPHVTESIIFLYGFRWLRILAWRTRKKMPSNYPEYFAKRFLFWIPFIALFVACAAAPVILEQQAREYGFQKIILSGIGFEHVGFEKHGNQHENPLHVYLEGDGSPWLSSGRIATDPTPRNPIMLGLMAMDAAPALYLGRPCYHGLFASRNCEPLLWTHRRYSAQVVDSMAEALRGYLLKHRHRGLVFCGHSGGGTLAVLLASRFPETRAVVTLAGNLDIERWTRHHGHTRLEGSLNPANLPPLAAYVREIHYAGANDTNVLPEFIVARSLRFPHVETRILQDFDHACCWREIWPTLLREIAVDE